MAVTNDQNMKSKKVFLILAFFSQFSCGISGVYAQDQRIADSLKLVLNQKATLHDSTVKSVLFNIILKTTNPDEILQYGDLLLSKVNPNESIRYKATVLNMQGVAYRMKGNIKQSLEKLFASAEIAVAENHHRLQEETYLEIAGTYAAGDDMKNALLFEKKALKIIRTYAADEQLALATLNLGYSYYQLNYLDSAEILYNEAAPLFKKLKMNIGIAYTLGNKALVYWKKDQREQAVKDLLASIDMLEPLGDLYGMTDYHNKLGEIYLELESPGEAIFHSEKALKMALQQGLKEQVRDALSLLSKLHTIQGNFQKALKMQTEYIIYKDSIQNNELTKKIADLRTEFEVGLKEKEIVVLEERQARKNVYIACAIVLLALSIVSMLYFRQRFLNTRLIASNQKLAHDDQVKSLMNQQETRALQSMVEGRDQERKRLAKDLHNHFGSLLATIKVNVNGIEEQSISNHGVLTSLIDQACTDMRNISHALNMGISDDFGLIPALRELTNHLNEGGSIKVDFDANMGQYPISSEDEILIYRIVQELVSNVLKHAQATKLTVSLMYYAEENALNIMVEDDGKGMHPGDENSKDAGIGISSMREMLHKKDGEIHFDSHPGRGTTVSIDLPVTPLNPTEL